MSSNCRSIQSVIAMMEENKVRIDKWLWAARFFKTRSQASHAVSGGRVYINGMRVKPARNVNIDDEIRIRKGELEFIIIVHALSDKRGPAVQARTLYEETEDSIAAREAHKEQRRLMAAERGGPVKRPGKRDRRLIMDFTRKGK